MSNNNEQADCLACAAVILETIPPLMGSIREEVRKHRGPGLSMPQFRSLMFIHRHPECSVSAVAQFLGLALPATSKQVDTLVRRGLVRREAHPSDRRRVTLRVTAKGESLRQAVRQQTQGYLAQRLAALSANEREQLAQAMRSLARAVGVADRSTGVCKMISTPTPTPAPGSGNGTMQTDSTRKNARSARSVKKVSITKRKTKT